ncbi:MAG: T9SS type A sorting domain-containing protein [Bacteroidia bacterium]
MKKTATFLILFSFIKTVAQPYEKMLTDSITHFRVVDLTPGVKPPNPSNGNIQSSNCLTVWAGEYFAQTDSVYHGLIYKRFYENTYMMGLMREDTVAKKVFFIPYCDTVEVLLYNFSLSVGSTISYAFSGSGFPNGTYKVDSIRFKHDYKNYYRRHFYLKNHSSTGNPTLEVIEGVGSVSHPLFLYGNFMQGNLSWAPGVQYCPAAKFNLVLSCKWNDGTKVYYDSCAYKIATMAGCVQVVDSCDYHNVCGAIEEFEGLVRLSVYPNPASDVLIAEIESEKEFSLTCSLVNALGIEVRKEKKFDLIKGKNSLKMNISDLPEGIYILKFSNEKNAGGKTIIISR